MITLLYLCAAVVAAQLVFCLYLVILAALDKLKPLQ